MGALPWLLIPYFAGAVISYPFLAIAYILNILFIKKIYMLRATHLIVAGSLFILPFNYQQGWLGKSHEFMVAYLLGALTSYLFYLKAYIKLEKKNKVNLKLNDKKT